MEFINLTPHDVVIMERNEIIKVIPASGNVARVQTHAKAVGKLDGIEVVKTVWGDIEGLPEPKEGIVYIVSMLVGQAAKRSDVIGPDTSPDSAIRNEAGQIVGCRRFQTFA
ncbi:hypothetical protein NDS46_31500 (plasmid) [Paenibacillus thiaminolyticus]|uniref:hypothetical protein n=1 Tax=Paenibacillus thiaminolyticus TaxID=49283 RepID=UPI00232D2F1E|nr:hypothetical protein [Paenibacillus thiaminolyticus]WCF11484.1 hypothetical protein NDS46_31500 [Paenibacillus thiaminolyticus]